MPLAKEYKKNIIHIWYNVKENICFAFLFKNIVNRWHFVIFLLFINALFKSFNLVYDSRILSYLEDLMLFYAILALIQKRCRDFGSKGTFWILAYSVAFTVVQVFHFTDIDKLEPLWRNIYVVGLDLQVAIFLFLFLIPSKKDAELKLRSPLLKYPFVYVAICWLVAIGATLAVDHYFSI